LPKEIILEGSEQQLTDEELELMIAELRERRAKLIEPQWPRSRLEPDLAALVRPKRPPDNQAR
jgi:hypothetical protein